MDYLTNTERVLAEALATYGHEAQVRMAIEEMSELIKALCKEARKPCEVHRQNVVEELADVFITLWQLEMIFCEAGEMDGQIEFKIERLDKIINGA